MPSSGTTTTDIHASIAALEHCLELIDSRWVTPHDLDAAIRAALAVPMLAGDPVKLEERCQLYQHVAEYCDSSWNSLLRVSVHVLPATWHGRAAETAGEGLDAVVADLANAHHTFLHAHDALEVWKNCLTASKGMETLGRDELVAAQRNVMSLTGSSWWLTRNLPFVWRRLGPIVAQVRRGCLELKKAFASYGEGGSIAGTELKVCSDSARAYLLVLGDGQPLDNIDKETLAYTTVHPGETPSTLADILTPLQLERVGQQFQKLSPTDQREFLGLLQNTRSPQQTAYLCEALDANYDLSQIKRFSVAMNKDGTNPIHLVPQIWDADQTLGSLFEAKYDGPGRKLAEIYSQGPYPTCVAASAVVGYLQQNPVAMYGMATGHGPEGWRGGNGPTGDSTRAFHSRLQTCFGDNYLLGQLAEPYPGEGLHPNAGALNVLNDLWTQTTGLTYKWQPVGGANEEQQQHFEQILKVYASHGVPVQLYVGAQNADMWHAMACMRLDEHDGHLVIYNPYGETGLVRAETACKGGLGYLTYGDLPDLKGADIPQH